MIGNLLFELGIPEPEEESPAIQEIKKQGTENTQKTEQESI